MMSRCMRRYESREGALEEACGGAGGLESYQGTCVLNDANVSYDADVRLPCSMAFCVFNTMKNYTEDWLMR